MQEAARRRGDRSNRLLLPTERSDVTVRWHPEVDAFSLALWHDGQCAASALLTPQDSAALSSFFVTQLGQRAAWGPRLVPAAPPASAAAARGLHRVGRRVRALVSRARA